MVGKERKKKEEEEKKDKKREVHQTIADRCVLQ